MPASGNSISIGIAHLSRLIGCLLSSCDISMFVDFVPYANSLKSHSTAVWQICVLCFGEIQFNVNVPTPDLICTLLVGVPCRPFQIHRSGVGGWRASAGKLPKVCFCNVIIVTPGDVDQVGQVCPPCNGK